MAIAQSKLEFQPFTLFVLTVTSWVIFGVGAFQGYGWGFSEGRKMAEKKEQERLANCVEIGTIPKHAVSVSWAFYDGAGRCINGGGEAW